MNLQVLMNHVKDVMCQFHYYQIVPFQVFCECFQLIGFKNQNLSKCKKFSAQKDFQIISLLKSFQTEVTLSDGSIVSPFSIQSNSGILFGLFCSHFQLTYSMESNSIFLMKLVPLFPAIQRNWKIFRSYANFVLNGIVRRICLKL